MTHSHRCASPSARSAALATGAFTLLSVASAHAADAAPVIDTGDTAWVLTASALVLMMTLPGLALFYGGLVRRRTVLNILMQCMRPPASSASSGFLVGYSLAFSTGNAWVGDLARRPAEQA
jgi:Amt family ammonium transporter